MKRPIIAGLVLLALVGGLGLAWLCLHPSARLLRQELLSLLAGKGQDRAERAFRQRLEILGKNGEALALRVVVRKAARQLTVFDGDDPLATFPIALGRVPVGQKEHAIDGRTPEGEYAICYRKENSRYHLFLGLSYPNPEDAARGLAKGLITATEAEAILDAAMNKHRPPWNTALGGPFGLHGFGTGDDWTEGTIALANAHIEELYWNLPDGTPVTVLP